MTFKEFAEKHDVTLEYQTAPSNPSMPNESDMAHWFVALKRGEMTTSLHYSKGSGHRRWKKLMPRNFRGRGQDRDRARDYGYKPGVRAQMPFGKLTAHGKELWSQWTEPIEPDVAEVLECLHSDASLTDDYSLDEFAREMSITAPSEAIRSYQQIQDQTSSLRGVLGSTWDEFGRCEG